MASPQEPQLDELRKRARRRLVGAIVLALAAAVLVPMLLESEPKPLGEDVSVKIPPVDEGRFVNQLGEKRAEGAKPTPPSPSTAPAAKALEGSAADPSAFKEPAAKESATKEVAPAAPGVSKALSDAERRVIAPPPATSPPKPPVAAPKLADSTPKVDGTKSDAARAESSKLDTTKADPAKSDTTKSDAPTASPRMGSDGVFSVQLAAFADDKGANALAGKLKKAGHPAYTEAYATSRGTLWRVRVGPYASRDAAESARSKLKSEGQNGIITAAK